MNKKFREGSMGAAEQKSNKRFVIGASILIVAIALTVYVIPNDLHSFFLVTKSWTKYLGLLSFACALVMVYMAHNATVNEKSSGSYWLLVLGFIAFGIAVACGFDFSYFRLK